MQSYLRSLEAKHADLNLLPETRIMIGLHTEISSSPPNTIPPIPEIDMTSSNNKILKYWPNLIVNGCRTGKHYDLLEKMFVEFADSNDIFIVKSGTYLMTKEQYPFESTFSQVTMAYLQHFDKSLMTLLNLACENRQFRYLLQMLKLYWQVCQTYPKLSLGKDIVYLKVLKELFTYLVTRYRHREKELILTHKLITSIFECSALRDSACYFVYFDQDYFETLWGLSAKKIEVTTNICRAYAELSKIDELHAAFIFATETDTFSSLNLRQIIASGAKSNTTLNYLIKTFKDFISLLTVKFLRNIYTFQPEKFDEYLSLFIMHSTNEYILLIKFLVDIQKFQLTMNYTSMQSRHISDTKLYMTILYHLNPVKNLTYATELRNSIYHICDRKSINIRSQMQNKLRFKLAKFELKEFLLSS